MKSSRWIVVNIAVNFDNFRMKHQISGHLYGLAICWARQYPEITGQNTVEFDQAAYTQVVRYSIAMLANI